MKKYIKGDLTGLMLCKLALHSVDAAEGNFFSYNWSEKTTQNIATFLNWPVDTRKELPSDPNQSGNEHNPSQTT